MTDHPTPATPEATEREAREDVARLRGQVSTETTTGGAERERLADALIAAVAAVEYERGRRVERERIGQIVSQWVEQNNHVAPDDQSYFVWYDELTALLDRLREGA